MEGTFRDDSFNAESSYQMAGEPLNVTGEPDSIRTTMLNSTPIATLHVDGVDMLCLAQISATILADFSYNEIHNRRVALSISTRPCTSSQMELLRCAGAVPPSSRRCGLITRHEAERLVRSFTEGTRPPNLPLGFAFDVLHQCGWGCRGRFYVEKYTSSRAKCIECAECDELLAPNKFIFHSHRPRDFGSDEPTFRPADAANFNSWRRHIYLANSDDDPNIAEAWEDVKALFNGGNRQNVNVLTMTTLVSASAAASNSNASCNQVNSSSHNQSSAPKRPRTSTASPASSSGSAMPCGSNKRQTGGRNKFTSEGDAELRHRTPGGAKSSSMPKSMPESSFVSPQLTAGNADNNSGGVDMGPRSLPPLVGPGNMWLVDTLFKSLLMQSQSAALLPHLYAGMNEAKNNLLEAQQQAANSVTSEQLAAINLVKQKWPNHMVPEGLSHLPINPLNLQKLLQRQNNQVREQASTSSGQFLIKNLVDMEDE